MLLMIVPLADTKEVVIPNIVDSFRPRETRCIKKKRIADPICGDTKYIGYACWG